MQFAAPIYGTSFTPDTPITEPVTVQEVKDWCAIDHTDYDSQIPMWITAARRNIERWCGGITLVPGTASFKTSLKTTEDFVKFPYVLETAQVASLVVNATSDGEDDEEQVIDEDYYFDSSLRFVSTGDYRMDYDITVDVPDDLKQAILMLVAYRVRNKGDQELQLGIPVDIEAVINGYKLQCL